MRFLCDDWLCECGSSCSYSGKCIIIAAALSIIERSLLPNRPVFFVTAARRSSGKTTLFHMMMMAVLGTRAACAAWSCNRRGAAQGTARVPYGRDALHHLSDQDRARQPDKLQKNIELSSTTALYTDRKLGVSEVVAVAASTIHLFTGNNVGPKGDLASRALTATIVVDRADPETHSSTTIRLVGPRRTAVRSWPRSTRSCSAIRSFRTPNAAECKTRFKTWWRLCGSAVENAAKEHAASGAEHQDEITAMEAIFPPDRDEEWRVRRAELDHPTCPAQEINSRTCSSCRRKTMRNLIAC